MCRQGISQATVARTTGTADAVRVVFRLHGQVVVNGMADALHVDAARGNVGCNQDTQFLTLQQAKCACALALIHVTM